MSATIHWSGNAHASVGAWIRLTRVDNSSVSGTGCTTCGHGCSHRQHDLWAKLSQFRGAGRIEGDQHRSTSFGARGRCSSGAIVTGSIAAPARKRTMSMWDSTCKHM